MPIPTNPQMLADVIGAAADVAEIPANTPSGSGALSYQQGWPPITAMPLEAGGIAPEREYFNAVNRLLSQHLFFLQSGSLYPWDSGLDYLAGAHVLGADGHEYIALKPSGPDIPSGAGYVGSVDPTTDTDNYWLDFSDFLNSPRPGYELCEFYEFRNPLVRPGMAPAHGTLIADAAAAWPEAWAYLQTSAGQALCVTEAEWQTMSTDTWHTLADGTTVGWEGIGGVPYFVQDLGAGTLRLPDVRGMHREAAGSASLSVGGVAGDAIREIAGTILFCLQSTGRVGGAFYGGAVSSAESISPAGADQVRGFAASRVVPTGAVNRPRSYGVLACVYLGRPAS